MKTQLILLFLCQGASAASFYLDFLLSYGIPSVPEYVEVLNVEDVIVFYYDSTLNTGEARQDWIETMIKDDTEYWERNIEDCRSYYKLVLKTRTPDFMMAANQTKGVTTIQHLVGCEVDDHSKKVTGTLQYAYNGEEFLSFDMNKERWIALHPKAKVIKDKWDTYLQEHRQIKTFIFTVCPLWLKTQMSYGNTSLHRKDLPSVYLLQRTPSSPVSCLATGFYPEKAVIFWRKDGNEIHEGIEHGEILPNHDGSFQMFVDLNASKIPLKEWERYECIFHLSGVQNDLKTRLDKDVIKTNWNESDENLSVTSIAVIATLAILTVLIITVLSFTAYKMKNGTSPGSSAESLQHS